MSIISDIGTAITLLGKARELAKQTANIELQEIIVDLSGKLVDLKAELVDQKEEKLKLDERIKSLEIELAKATVPPEVTFAKGLYYTRNDDGPFCTACYDKDKMLIRATDVDPRNTSVLNLKWQCPVCEAKYPKR